MNLVALLATSCSPHHKLLFLTCPYNW